MVFEFPILPKLFMASRRIHSSFLLLTNLIKKSIAREEYFFISPNFSIASVNSSV